MRPCADTSPAPAEVRSDSNRRQAALASEILRELNRTAVGRVPPLTDRDPIIEVARAVDDRLAELANEEFSYTAILDTLAVTAADRPELREAVIALENLSERYAPAMRKIPHRLGSCPAVVFKALALFQRDEATTAEIEKVVSCDPVLASSLLSFANSSLYSRLVPVRSVAAAISYIGMVEAKRVVLTASSRPLFSSPELHDLWQHSVDVAAIAEQLAASTRRADPSEAFVAGLIHDIGRLAVELTNQDDLVITHRRLARDSGCAVLADIVLSGQDHGHSGAAILAAWSMPRDLIDAVRFHHMPELNPSPLASILYLAECVSDYGENVPSEARLHHAMATAGVHSLDQVKSDLRRLGTALAMVG